MNSNASTGYYIAIKGGGSQKKVSLNFNHNSNDGINNKEYKWKTFNAYLVSGYLYTLPNIFGLGGQVYVGCSAKNKDMNESWSHKAVKGNLVENYTMTSNLQFHNKFSTGFDTLLGLNICGFFVFGSVGSNFLFPRINGAIFGKAQQIDFGTYYGKNEKDIENIHFPKVKPSFCFVHVFSIGFGIRRYFLDRLFAGIEFKHFIPKTKDLKLKYSVYDPDGILGNTTGKYAIEGKEKVKIPVKIRNTGIDFIIGLRL
jgi:hypothetical protein